MNLLRRLAIGKLCPLRRAGGRRGVAAVEAAITLPLLILLVFGSIELANGIFLNQALSAAAYEGAREASRPGGTAAVAQQRIGEVLVSRGIANFTLSISPVVTRRAGITVHTVTMLTSYQPDVEEIARITGGRHFTTNSEAELRHAFHELARSLHAVLVD